MLLSTHVGSVDIKLNLDRLDRRFKEAQKVLNLAVKKDCEPYVPHLNGGLRDSAKFPEGVYGGKLEYNVPYARYMYGGELYLAANGSSWAQKDEKKYPSGKPLEYHEPGTTDHWFEEAKKKHGKEWVKAVKNEIRKR